MIGTMAGKLPCFPRLDPWPMPAITLPVPTKVPSKVPSPLYLLTTRILNPDRLADQLIDQSAHHFDSGSGEVFLSLSRGREKEEAGKSRRERA